MGSSQSWTLNPTQWEAVRHGQGPLLVLAGAGSGKTRVLTHRVAYLVEEQGVYPSRILAITFTNKAAAEMKERLQQLIPGETVSWVMTFHAAANRILRQEIEALGYARQYTIYDDSDQERVLRAVLKHFDLDEKVLSPRAVSSRISDAKNRLLGPRQLGQQAVTLHEQRIADIYTEYQKRLQEANALDFDDLLMLTVKLFQEHPPLLTKYQDKFQYILVDEYQDTNQAQYVLVNLLAARHRNLCVVGDPDQSIYGWRGADLRNILDFQQDYPDAVTVTLEQNYRSTKVILQAANQVVSFNQNRLPKELRTEKPEGEKILLQTAADEKEEARFVAETFESWRRAESRGYNQFAVFYRTHGQTRVLEETFLHYGIPYRIYGGQSFYKRKEIKDILSYLRLLVNPTDNVSLERVINVPRRGIGDTTWARLVQRAEEKNLPYYFALQELAEGPECGAKIRRSLQEFVQLIEDFRRQGEADGITTLTWNILERSGYWSELGKEEEARRENLQEFLSLTREYDERRSGWEEEAENGEETAGLAHFLGRVALITDLDKYQEGEQAVSLMTMHSSKGLEFPVVAVLGMEENLFPHGQAREDQQELEEERRLCYVVLTRAQERLLLTRAERRMLYGSVRYNEPSRFLREIPPELIAGSISRQPATAAPAAPARKPLGASHLFHVGDRVVHRKWGKGVIVQVRGEGDDYQVAVAFPDQGIKQLLMKYAPLEPA